MIFARSTIGTPPPPADRHKLAGVGVLLAHEVGVNTPPGGRYRSTDPTKVRDDARAAASYGVSSGRPWEYSYMIGLDGTVYEQAGEYQAAHCLNYNRQSAGIIFLNALDVQVNTAQIVAWHDLRTHMVTAGILSPDHQVAPHYRYRTTSCPGIRAEPPGPGWRSPTGQGRTGNLIDALQTSPAPPTPPAPTGYRRIIMVSSFEFATAPRWDTRGFGTPIPAGEYPVKLDGSDGKAGVTVNVTVVQPTSAGYATVWQAGPRPDTSILNWNTGDAVANEISVPLAADGTFRIFIAGPAHIIVDLVGYWLV